MLKFEYGNLHLDVKDWLFDTLLSSGSKFLNHPFKITNGSFFLWILPWNYHSKMRKLEKIDFSLKVSDEIVI